MTSIKQHVFATRKSLQILIFAFRCRDVPFCKRAANCHTFPPTGNTAYLLNGGSLDKRAGDRNTRWGSSSIRAHVHRLAQGPGRNERACPASIRRKLSALSALVDYLCNALKLRPRVSGPSQISPAENINVIAIVTVMASVSATPRSCKLPIRIGMIEATAAAAW